jgi:hypothetical protein
LAFAAVSAAAVLAWLAKPFLNDASPKATMNRLEPARHGVVVAALLMPSKPTSGKSPPQLP